MLRALETRRFRRAGGTTEVKSDFRIVSATNRSEVELRAGQGFRADLLYRLGILTVRVPPLRERQEDLSDLVQLMLGEMAGAKAGSARIDGGQWPRLAAYQWPGNLRELRNVVERAMILSRDGSLDLVAQLPPTVQTHVAVAAPVAHAVHVPPGTVRANKSLASLADAERKTRGEALRHALTLTGGNKTRAAQALDVSLTHFKRLLKQHPEIETKNG